MGALSIALMYLMEVLRLRMYEAMPPPQIEEGKAEVGVKTLKPPKPRNQEKKWFAVRERLLLNGLTMDKKTPMHPRSR